MNIQNQEKIADLVNKLLTKVPFPELGEVIIFGSSAVVLNGMNLNRIVDDLDLFASDLAYAFLRERYATEEIEKSPGVFALHIGVPKIEILKTFPGVEHADVQRRSLCLSNSQNLLVGSIEDLCTWKRTQGRKKDLEDLQSMGC